MSVFFAFQKQTKTLTWQSFIFAFQEQTKTLTCQSVFSISGTKQKRRHVSLNSCISETKQTLTCQSVFCISGTKQNTDMSV